MTSKRNHDTHLSDGIAVLRETHQVNKTNAAAFAKSFIGQSSATVTTYVLHSPFPSMFKHCQLFSV